MVLSPHVKTDKWRRDDPEERQVVTGGSRDSSWEERGGRHERETLSVRVVPKFVGPGHLEMEIVPSGSTQRVDRLGWGR